MPARVVLVDPGPGAPEMLSLEAWQALARGAIVAHADPMAARLDEGGIPVERLEHVGGAAAGSDAGAGTASGAASAPPGAPRGRLPLLTEGHAHSGIPPEARDIAQQLASVALERGEAVFVLPRAAGVVDDAVTKAVFERALRGDLEVEVVIGRLPRGHRLLAAVRVMARLRGPGGCPWDHEQDHRSLLRYLIDETYELVEAVEAGAPGEVAEELGDLLLQVLFHAQIGADEATFDIDDVAEGLVRKLVTRHPHVFADVEVSGADEVVANWDEIKRREKGRAGALEGVPEGLPSLAYAQKLLRRAGDGWRRDAAARLADACAELSGMAEPDRDRREAAERAAGEALFSMVAALATLGIDAETALRGSARRFRDRIQAAEAAAGERGIELRDLLPEERARLWAEPGGSAD